MRILLGLGLAASLFLAAPAFSQTVEVSRQNRTIEVVVTQTVQVPADIAEITLGCVTYGETHNQAYQANLAIADKVVKALLTAGVKKADIESSMELSEANPGDNADQTVSVKKTRQFKAHQSWTIRAASARAQKLIDIAVQAGANGVENVNWEVADTDGLEAKARAAAMEKARKTAGDIAQSAGGKLGELLYASNTMSALMSLIAGRTVETESAEIGNTGNGFPTPAFSLQLFPQKVESRATVRTIFALD
ncbi:MAG: SIMPL domain-containing protein [Candidatus Acidiferrales bacterium]